MDDYDRPMSEQLSDLHVYLIPPDHWRTHLHSAVNQIINEAVSAGFVRVTPETTIYQLRTEFEQQLGYEILPQEFVFLKSVGRCLTRVRPKQEFQLKVKNFLPPSSGSDGKTPGEKAYAPEIFVLEATPEVRSVPYSGTSSQSSLRQNATPRSDRSEFTGHKPIPPIKNTIAIQTSDNIDSPPRAPERESPDTHPRGHPPGYPYRDTPRKPVKEQPPQTLIVHSQSPVNDRATQYSRPSTPYYNSHTPSPNHPPISDPNPNDSRYERVQTPQRNDASTSPLLDEVPRKLSDKTKHVVFKDSIPNDYSGTRSPQYFDRPDPQYRNPSPRSPLPPSQGQREGDKPDHMTPPKANGSPPQSPEGQGRSHTKHQSQPPGQSHGHRPPDRSHLLPHHHHSNHTPPKNNSFGEESGISDGPDMSPEEQSRVDELMRQDDDDEKRRRRLLRDAEEERRREEEKRQWEEEQRRRKRAQQQLEDEQRRRAEDDERKQRMQEEENPRDHRHGAGSREHSKDPLDTSDLKEELRRAKHERQEMERLREELVKKAKLLQNKTQQKRNQARDAWKKKYFEEKKRTGPLEEQCNKLQRELEALHRKIMSQLEGAKDPTKHVGENKPSQQSNLRIQATRLGHDIEDLQRRVENVKMKLTTEMKLRNQAQGELKALRAELTQKKISMALTRSQQSHQPAISHSQPAHGYKEHAPMISPRS